MELLGRLSEINKKLITLKAERERLTLTVSDANALKVELEQKVSKLEADVNLAKESKAQALKKLDVVIEKLI